MKRVASTLSPETWSLLRHERALVRQPAAVKARAVARARAALADRAVVAAGAARTPSRLRLPVVAALLCAGSAAVGAVAYDVRMLLARRAVDTAMVSPLPAEAPSLSSATLAALPPQVSTLPRCDSSTPPRRTTAGARSPKADAPGAELRVLRQAREAVAHQDFAAALQPLAEHARFFKEGRLVEEREALLIRALAGLGRVDDARCAAAAFETRFPRSVLLRAVRRMAELEP